jgi:hypothetical protein
VEESQPHPICQNIGGCLIKYMTKRITFTTKLSIAQGG